MKKSIVILMMVTTGFLSSGQSSKDSVYVGSLDSVKAEVVIELYSIADIIALATIIPCSFITL